MSTSRASKSVSADSRPAVVLMDAVAARVEVMGRIGAAEAGIAHMGSAEAVAGDKNTLSARQA